MMPKAEMEMEFEVCLVSLARNISFLESNIGELKLVYPKSRETYREEIRQAIVDLAYVLFKS